MNILKVTTKKTAGQGGVFLNFLRPLMAAAITHKISETNSSFQVK